MSSAGSSTPSSPRVPTCSPRTTGSAAAARCWTWASRRAASSSWRSPRRDTTRSSTTRWSTPSAGRTACSRSPADERTARRRQRHLAVTAVSSLRAKRSAPRPHGIGRVDRFHALPRLVPPRVGAPQPPRDEAPRAGQGAIVPPAWCQTVRVNDVDAAELSGWRHSYSGKVRDLYVPDGGAHASDDVVLVVASDRISAYDHILPTTIPDKGAVLTALSLWWFEQLSPLVANHVVSLDVPEAVRGRAMICRRLEMYPVECVARGYLTGSGLVEYADSGKVCGVRLPAGLVDGSRLPEPIFTPATKADLGEHDVNVSFDVVA
ncbi:MAG: hypothetical protein JJE50_10450, partial [Actinomycetales bacterium]|nr:hypothetical protein [Actinomycetales bacterium]